MTEPSLAAYKQAYREVTISDNRRGFKSHLTVYVIMNTILTTINILTNPDSLWCLGGIVGWGTGVVAHYVTAVVTIAKKLYKMERAAEELAQAS